MGEHIELLESFYDLGGGGGIGIDLVGLPAEGFCGIYVFKRVVEEDDFGAGAGEFFFDSMEDGGVGFDLMQEVGGEEGLEARSPGVVFHLDPVFVAGVGEGAGDQALSVELIDDAGDTFVFAEDPMLVDGLYFIRGIEAIGGPADLVGEFGAGDESFLILPVNIPEGVTGMFGSEGIITERQSGGMAALGPGAADTDDYAAEVEADGSDGGLFCG